MTCKEKLQQEHPELVDDLYCGGCAGCPHLYGYLDKPKGCFFSASEEKCRDCWDNEIPEQDPRQSVVEMLYSNLINRFNMLVECVLGKDYYNTCLDVYSGHQMACDDILKTHNELKEERDKYKKAFQFSILSMAMLVLIVFFFVI